MRRFITRQQVCFYSSENKNDTKISAGSRSALCSLSSSFGVASPKLDGDWLTFSFVNDSQSKPMSVSPQSGSELTHTPDSFSRAVESMHRAVLRNEISLGTIRPPQRLAPFSHAIGLEITPAEAGEPAPNVTDGDAFGRLILLHDPQADETWEGSMRLVAYIQADMDHAVASDPMLPEVAWQWLTEGLSDGKADYHSLGGTVTSTSSVRFGEIGGPPSAYQLEMRASWTAASKDLEPHVVAFSKVLANVAGLPPEGVAQITPAVSQ